MTHLEVLKAAYHLLDDKKRWTRCAPARDASGRALAKADDPRAVAWCASGAIWHVRGWDNVGDMTEWKLLANAIAPDSDIMQIAHTNNGPDGYELIRQAFRKAIADLELSVERAPAETSDRELVAV